MLLTEDCSDARYLIRAYQPGVITVNDTDYTHSLIITSEHLQSDWPPQSLAELQSEHFAPILALQPEIVLLGTGTHFIMPPTSLLAPLYQQQLGVECMDTSAACRTFVALVAEGRQVVAALLIK